MWESVPRRVFICGVEAGVSAEDSDFPIPQVGLADLFAPPPRLPVTPRGARLIRLQAATYSTSQDAIIERSETKTVEAPAVDGLVPLAAATLGVRIIDEG